MTLSSVGLFVLGVAGVVAVILIAYLILAAVVFGQFKRWLNL